MRSSWCMGMTERPSTTEISTLILSMLEAMAHAYIAVSGSEPAGLWFRKA
jgi:hypothetical protein